VSPTSSKPNFIHVHDVNKLTINFRENRKDNRTWTIQRHR